MGIDQKTINEIVRCILSVTQPDRIILFGSAATGTMSPDSDIDLLILKTEKPSDRAEWLTITRSLRGIQFAFDVVLMATEAYEESKNVIGGIAYPAHKYGRTIYEAA
ncbi:nucleotidyltransferase domain-containing protein [bacterium]|nr:nucleotidyltransferase domain-containing protein [bacterium]